MPLGPERVQLVQESGRAEGSSLCEGAEARACFWEASQVAGKAGERRGAGQSHGATRPTELRVPRSHASHGAVDSGLGHPEDLGCGGSGRRGLVTVLVCVCVHVRARAVTSVFSVPKETLRKFRAWSQAKAQLAEQKSQAEKQAILAQGGDAFKHLFHQRRCQELEAQKR